MIPGRFPCRSLLSLLSGAVLAACSAAPTGGGFTGAGSGGATSGSGGAASGGAGGAESSGVGFFDAGLTDGGEGVGPGTSSDVFLYKPSDGTTTKVSSVTFEIVGAGVSTCAPLAQPT